MFVGFCGTKVLSSQRVMYEETYPQVESFQSNRLQSIALNPWTKFWDHS